MRKRRRLRPSAPTPETPMSLKDPNVLNPQRAKARRPRHRQPRRFHHHRLAGGLLVERADPPLPCVHRDGLRGRGVQPRRRRAARPTRMSDPNDASGYSKTDLISQGFIHTPELKALVETHEEGGRHRRGGLRRHRGGRRPGADVHLRERHRPAREVRGLLRSRQGGRRAVPRHGDAAPTPRRRTASRIAKGRPSPASPTSKKTSPTTRSGATACCRATST